MNNIVKREIILDTETTGLDPSKGDRMVEVGCVEMIDGMRTGAFFHSYLNPQRDVPEGAFKVHGLSTEFLKDKPLFATKVDEFLEFIADSQLVIHNAPFDMKFINAELAMLGFDKIPMTRTVDTLLIARNKFPGSPANLDALCKRFNIDISGRQKHGALLDAELLADVYLDLLGGRQAIFSLDSNKNQATNANNNLNNQTKTKLEARIFEVIVEELEAHETMIKKLKNPIWAEAI